MVGEFKLVTIVVHWPNKRSIKQVKLSVWGNKVDLRQAVIFVAVNEIAIRRLYRKTMIN